MPLKTIFPSLFLFFFATIALAQNELEISNQTDFSIGETIQFQSTILNEDRTINIYLPNSYHSETTQAYPVIYLLDGSVDEDFIHISGLVQFGSFSWINMLPETIVVGIGNVDRQRDFTYPTNNTQDKADFPNTGGSAQFIQFLEEELQPLIENNYRLTDTKTIIGQSLGGLVATEILFTKPDLFDNYIIVSPSLWWDDESLLAKTPLAYTSAKSIYVAVGEEGRVMKRTARQLHKKLNRINQASTNLYFHFLKAQNHGDALHLAVYHAFEKMFNQPSE